MNLQELAQAAIDARAAAVVAVTQFNAADAAARAATEFVTETKANTDTVTASFVAAKAALVTALEEPLV